MIRIIPSAERYTANHGWLQTRYSFSFADYYAPDNLQFGALRVLNDDIIAPGKGFGRHPHSEMEIVTYVIEGTLEHMDSLGNKGVINPGEVQRMTAGTGLYHSEYNHSNEEPVHLLQLWFLPAEKRLKPSWEQKQFTKEEQLNRLLPVVSGSAQGEALAIHQDMTIYMSNLDAGSEVSHTLTGGRRAHLFVIKGEVTLNGEHKLTKGDAARITDTADIRLAATSQGEFMLIDLA